MLYTDRIKNLSAVYPKLSRVWIKTEDARRPLKSIWISDSVLLDATQKSLEGECEPETAELGEDHLIPAA